MASPSTQTWETWGHNLEPGVMEPGVKPGVRSCLLYQCLFANRLTVA